MEIKVYSRERAFPAITTMASFLKFFGIVLFIVGIILTAGMMNMMAVGPRLGGAGASFMGKGPQNPGSDQTQSIHGHGHNSLVKRFTDVCRWV